ncbi:MAG: hypothetical protein HZC40_23055 [Chloroflexi bacterium]|nr:hypothetical protein [Chloroflexota bacterium]
MAKPKPQPRLGWGGRAVVGVFIVLTLWDAANLFTAPRPPLAIPLSITANPAPAITAAPVARTSTALPLASTATPTRSITLAPTRSPTR